VLWIALVINGLMFVAELIAGSHAASSSVQADSLDFLADSANYAISLFVVAAAAAARARAAWVKGASMIVLAGVVIVTTVVRLIHGDVPRPAVMSIIGIAAIIANLAVLGLLLSFRHGDANRRSVWICTRNDVIGNVAVLLAATGVFAVGSIWPDTIVAIVMAYLGLRGGWQIVATARHELDDARLAHRT